MTITKLKTIGSWQTPRAYGWPDSGAQGRGQHRGRVITGLLTGDSPSDPIVPEPRKR
jgi:hypothetical protein